jgi:hypothetical protein
VVAMKKLVVLLALLVLVSAGARADTSGPPFQPGPAGGDQFNYKSADGASGRVTLVRVYPQPGSFNCSGEGGYATFIVQRDSTMAPSSVDVSFTEAVLDGYTWITGLVRDPTTKTWYGGGKIRGPLTGDGTLHLGLTGAGTATEIVFGLEVASACPNIDGGTVRFTSVTVS